MKELKYPFKSAYIRRKKKSIKRNLLQKENLIEKKIAILGGSTTNEVKDMMELFLLDYGFKPSFYESEFGRYWEDAVFGNEELDEFKPDIVYIHTSVRNIIAFPEISEDEKAIEEKRNQQFQHMAEVWKSVSEKYHCVIIQNNFDYPYYRLMGNQDASNIHGRVNFVCELNRMIYEYAQSHEGFFINDINYQAAEFGLKEWANPQYWYMYKYAMCPDAMATVGFNVANIIKSVYGKNKKALAIDLDNTMWGGIVGDDGVENLKLGKEAPEGEVFDEFQHYLKELQKQGVLLNIISKNERENAIAGIHHPQMVLKEEDFISIKANWDPKSKNLVEMAGDIGILPESFVFVDDNPAEREIIRQQVPGAGIANLESPEQYISAIDGAGFFEVTTISKDDLERTSMYRKNSQRMELQKSFTNYKDYLASLKMKAVIKPFESVYMARIAQLTNKSNQFNLTTRRYSQEEIESIAADDRYITLYGSLEDCFGDNGVVSIVIGEIVDGHLDIILWLMSCRVLKRDMEYAVMDRLMHICKEKGISEVYGYYYPTAKNGMVKLFYDDQGFDQVSCDEDGNSVWKMQVEQYEDKNDLIEVNAE
ncbi:MAG: HAD-IIIC family phosphatase [Eubacterium sp.]|nr:HAD-IIIC family phosphatase [Eubacterium sp.]